MSDYTKLIAHWPSVVGATTALKLAALNLEMVAGTVDPNLTLTATQIFSALDAGEWQALQADPVKSSIIRDILRLPDPIPCAAGTTASNFLFNYLGPVSLANLAVLATAKPVPWWHANGYPRAFDLGDIAAAGLS